MICQAFNFEAGESQGTFLDVAEGQWYVAYVESMAEKQLLLGDEDGRMRPDETITREDAAVILHRTLQYAGTTLSGTAQFVDEADIASYALQPVGALAQSGILQGYDQRFAPKDALSRAQAVTLIYNSLSVAK